MSRKVWREILRRLRQECLSEDQVAARMERLRRGEKLGVLV